MGGGWPLTGRAAELEVIADALGAHSAFGGVVLVGPAGVGKTRLAAEVARLARRQGWATKAVTGTYAARAIPMGAFMEWADGLDGDPLTVVRQVIDAITAHDGDAPTLITVDDAHLLDEISVFVLCQIIVRRAAAVIVTIRSGEPVPQPLTALWKDDRLRRLDLQPLSRYESDALLSAVLGGPVGPDCAERMWRLTQGNVLFLNRIVEQELGSGALMMEGGEWIWAGPIHVSASLVDVVEAQIGNAPKPVVDVVDLVTVAEPLELDCLVRLADSEAIEEAETRGLITLSSASTGDVATVGHPLYAELRMATSGLWRLRRLRGRVAEALLAGGPSLDGVDPIRLGLLWIDSDLVPDSSVLVAAAWTAIARLDLMLTERFAQAACRAGAGLDCQLLRAQMLILLNKGQTADTLLGAIYRQELPDPVRSTVVQLRATNLLWTLGKVEESWKLVDDVLANSVGVVRQGAQAFRAFQLAVAARPAEAIALAGAIDRSQLPPLPALLAIWSLTIAAGDLGQAQRAAEYALEGAALVARSPEISYQALPLVDFHVVAVALGGDVKQAEAVAEFSYRQCADLPGITKSVATAIRGMAALYGGDLSTATEYLGSALGDFGDFHADDAPSYHHNGTAYQFMVHNTDALARTGATDEALRALEQVETFRHPALQYIESDRLVAKAWVAAARGRTSQAQKLALQAAELARGHGQSGREVICLQTAIHFGHAQCAARLRELADQVDGPRAMVAARWGDGLRTGDGDALLAASEEFESLGDRLAAADTAAHAAQAFTRQSRRGAALTASLRATRIAADCGAKTPATDAVATPLPLSRREREIAMMVAEGLSNRRIAEALVLSVRTVEGHVQRIFSRVGVNSRAELARLMTESAGR